MKDDLVERLAEIIDPRAFKSHRSLYDHCLSAGDDDSEAKQTAEWAHGGEIDEAIGKANAVLAIARPAIHNEALEEAAQKSESLVVKGLTDGRQIASAIRSLAHTTGQEGGR